MIRSFPLVPVSVPDPLTICARRIPSHAEGFRSSAVTAIDRLSTFEEDTDIPAANAVAVLIMMSVNRPKRMRRKRELLII